MAIKTVPQEGKDTFNKLAGHPLQSWEWGEFRKKTGIEVIRLGKYRAGKLIETAQVTIHRLPFTSKTIGYFPKGGIPSIEMLKALVKIGKEYKCIFIKLEPNINKSSKFKVQSSKLNLRPSPHPLFTKYTFQLDIDKSEEELMLSFHPKTRYNIKVAQKHGVVVTGDTSEKAFNDYLSLVEETTRRQRFFAHTRKYHQLMWETLNSANIAHLLTARIKTETLVAWVVFLFNGVLYYPYGASSSTQRKTMASNLMMWEAIKFGKKHNAKMFDLWGSLGKNPDPEDPWYGFHRFKLGYNPRLVEFAGSFDLVIEPVTYKLYNAADIFRKIFLSVKARTRKP